MWLKGTMRPLPISVSESFSNRFMKFSRGVAAVLFWIAATSFAQDAQASVQVRGMPSWLVPPAERALSAVWAKIPEGYEASTRRELLETVATRLFEGYQVDRIGKTSSGSPFVFFVSSRPVSSMEVRIVSPDLGNPLNRWFEVDVEGLEDEVRSLVVDVPLDALAWGGESLRSAVTDLFRRRLPGWEPSLMVLNSNERPVVEIRLRPDEPFVLAVEPHLDSSSLPVTLIRTDIQEDIFRLTRRVAGIPVPWLELHRRDFENWVVAGLAERQLVEHVKGTVRVEVSPARITKARVNLESRRYAIRGWIAAYAGTEDRYPELGLHLGRRVQPWSGWDAELYVEGVLGLEDFNLENRWGFRWTPWDNVWAGVERVFPEDRWWGRLSFEAGPRNSYVWWRFSEEDEHNFGIGYRLNEYISLELHYDERDDDRWSIRALGNL